MYLTISNSLIILSILLSVLNFIQPDLDAFHLHSIFFYKEMFPQIWIQILTFSFFHNGFFHLLWSILFIYWFGNKIEYHIGTKYYIWLFISSVLLTWYIWIFHNWEMYSGMGSFIFTLLTLYTAILYKEKNPEYKWGLTALVIFFILGVSSIQRLQFYISGLILGLIFFFIYIFIQHKKTN